MLAAWYFFLGSSACCLLSQYLICCAGISVDVICVLENTGKMISLRTSRKLLWLTRRRFRVFWVKPDSEYLQYEAAAKLVFCSINWPYLHLINWSSSPEFPIVCWTFPGIVFCCLDKLGQLAEIWEVQVSGSAAGCREREISVFQWQWATILAHLILWFDLECPWVLWWTGHGLLRGERISSFC